MDAGTRSQTGTPIVPWRERDPGANTLEQLVGRAIRHPDLLSTDAFRRRFQRLVRTELAARRSRGEVTALVESRLAAAPADVADSVLELLAVGLMPGHPGAESEGVQTLLSRLAGAASAREAGKMLVAYLRERYGEHVGLRLTLAVPQPLVVASVACEGPESEALTAHWAEGDREIGQWVVYGLDQDAREELGAMVPWLQPVMRRLAEAERARQTARDLRIEGRAWRLKAELLALTQTPQASDAYLRQLVKRVRELFEAEQVVFWAYRAEDDSLEARTRAMPEEPMQAVTLGVFQEAIHNRHVRTAAVPDGRGGMRMLLIGPLYDEDKLEGVLQIELAGDVLGLEYERDLALVCGYAMTGLKTVRFFEQLSYHASQDALTGLANRRSFQQFIDREFRLARRHGTPLALLMVDVDHFKRYNDSYGHPAGDALLVGLGQTLAAAVRCTDYVARLGGEEFAIVLPHTDVEGAQAVAEKVLAGVRSLHERDPRVKRPVSVSIGAASFPSAEGLEALIEQADQALYAAKHGGRDRIATIGS